MRTAQVGNGKKNNSGESQHKNSSPSTDAHSQKQFKQNLGTSSSEPKYEEKVASNPSKSSEAIWPPTITTSVHEDMDPYLNA